MKDRVLVTGGKGFIGSHLMEFLGEDGDSFDLKDGDDILLWGWLNNCLNYTHPKYIIHLAAISNRKDVDRDPEHALATNIIGTYNVLDLALKHKVKKVIVASSAAGYEPELSLYGTSKVGMEAVCNYFRDKGLNVCIARFFNVYGPGSKSVVNKFIKNIQQGKEITLNGNTTRDYIYVDDVVTKLVNLLDDQRNPSFVEIGTGISTSLKELVKKIEKVSGKKAIITYGKPIKEIQHSWMNEGKNLETRISLEGGIRRLLDEK